MWKRFKKISLRDSDNLFDYNDLISITNHYKNECMYLCTYLQTLDAVS